MGKRKVGQTLQGTFEEHQTNRRGKQKAGKLGKPTNRDLGEMELGLYEEDDSETDFDDDGEPSRQNVIAARHNGKNSANSPAANQLRMPAAMKANNKPHGRPGLEMASEMEEQVRYIQRCSPICFLDFLYKFPHRPQPYCSSSV